MEAPDLETMCTLPGRDLPAVAATGSAIFQASAWPIEGLEEADELLGGRRRGYFYARDGNPNADALGEAVACLEGAEAGLACASGMAATLVTLLALAEDAPDKTPRIAASTDLYGKTTALLREFLPRLGIPATFVESRDAAAWEDAFRSGASIGFVESLSNPLVVVCDIATLAGVARSHGAALVVDNTMLTPVLLRPRDLGAQVVVHSATKFLGGHGDVTAGVVVGSAPVVASARRLASLLGMALSPFEAWLALRGLRTLALRMERCSANALALARFLAGHPKVSHVHYPGLEAHPQHLLARRLLPRGFGGVLSFELHEGFKAASAFVGALHRVKFVASFGDVASSLSHPTSTSHRSLTAEERRQAGITDGLIRLSVGVEAANDLLEDLKQALDAA